MTPEDAGDSRYPDADSSWEYGMTQFNIKCCGMLLTSAIIY
jgi:hypothetical protein